MPRSSGRAHVVRVKKTHVDRQGRERVYESVLLRRTYRDGPKVRNQTLANLSMLPAAAIAALEATLKGHTLVPADGQVRVVRALPHGHVAAVARQLGLPALLGPACRSRDLALALCHLAGDPTHVQAVHAGVVVRLHPGGGPAGG